VNAWQICSIIFNVGLIFHPFGIYSSKKRFFYTFIYLKILFLETPKSLIFFKKTLP
jgi:hypothetical protein